jgi:hypothetical protein
MRIVNCQQGTDEWLDARLGLVTASELDALITPKWKVKDMDDAGPQTYLFRKLAEAWTCMQVQTFGSFAMEQGTVLEPQAFAWFELQNNCDVKKVGFIVGDDNRCGCSPDGIIDTKQFDASGDNPLYHGLELKCPQPTNAVRYALAGELPPEYELQVHGSLYVSGFKLWNFVSYSRHLPKFHTVVDRDESKCAKISEALAGFYERFDAEWDNLNKLADEPRINPFAK